MIIVVRTLTDDCSTLLTFSTAEVDAVTMAYRCNNMRSLSRLDILLRTKEYEGDYLPDHGFLFSRIFWRKLKCTNIKRLQVNEMFFERDSLRNALSELRNSLITLHLRLVTLKTMMVYQDLLVCLIGMVSLTSLELSLLNTYRASKMMGIQFPNMKKTFSWEKESYPITELVENLYFNSSETNYAYCWDDVKKD
jgi:hypothetical protein